MTVPLSSTEGSSGLPVGLVIVAVPGESDTKACLREHFRLDEDNTTRFSNRYYSATVPVSVYNPIQMRNNFKDESFCDAISTIRALAVVSVDDASANVSTCQAIWEQLNKHSPHSATRILYLDGSTMNEEDTYSLVDWARKRGVQLISRFLCEEDGISPAVSIERALECSQWLPMHLKQSEEECGTASDEYRQVEDKIDSHPDKSSVSRPTRLRRGLGEDDVSRLLSDLMLEDEESSDDSG